MREKRDHRQKIVRERETDRREKKCGRERGERRERRESGYR